MLALNPLSNSKTLINLTCYNSELFIMMNRKSDKDKERERKERIQHPHHIKSKSHWDWDTGYYDLEKNDDPEKEKKE